MKNETCCDADSDTEREDTGQSRHSIDASATGSTASSSVRPGAGTVVRFVRTRYTGSKAGTKNKKRGKA